MGAAGGLVYYALAFWLYLIGLQQAPASLAYLVLGERLTLAQWGGALLILVAVVTIVRLQQQPAPAQVTTQAA
jgi:drug/metabolite transporter (DMT)-like permease